MRASAQYGLLSLAAYIVVLFLDSVVCMDCSGGVQFSGQVEISHLDARHVDIVPSAGN